MRQSLRGYVASGNYQLGAILGPRRKASTIAARTAFPLLSVNGASMPLDKAITEAWRMVQIDQEAENVI